MCNNDYVHRLIAPALMGLGGEGWGIQRNYDWALFMVRLDSRNTIWRGRYLDAGRVVKWGFGPFIGWRP